MSATMYIWRAAIGSSLKIRASLDNQGAGAFGLWRMTPQGSFEPVGLPNPGAPASGRATFEISAAQLESWGWPRLLFEMGVTAFHPGQAKMAVFLDLYQGNTRLLADDGLGNAHPMQANGVEHPPKLSPNEGDIFDFQVSFS